MADWGIDTSVVAKWLLPEPDTALAERAGMDIQAAGDRLWIIDLARVETANAIRTRFHRGKIDAPTATRLFGEMQFLAVNDESHVPYLPAAFDLALRYGVAVYDALFVAFCHTRGINGLTADEPLWRAVRADFPHIHLLRHWPPTP
jgi:predicted nucleic acid-binding protein